MPEGVPPPRTLLTGRSTIESARWHDGRLWFADWGGCSTAVQARRSALVLVTEAPVPRG